MTDQRKNNSIVWECKCSCGRTHYATANNLKSHRIESCGCIKESKGIRKIKKLLDNNSINYTTEKTFPNCKFENTNQFARFDFYINDEFLLEFDGIQHFKDCDNYYFKDTLEKRQNHDQYKNNWCKENNIPLKRIPYTDFDKITISSIMGDDYLI